MFQAVTDKTNPFFQPLQCSHNGGQMLGKAAPNQICHERQDGFRLLTSVRALWRWSCLERLHGSEERGETGCDLFFYRAQSFAESCEQFGSRSRFRLLGSTLGRTRTRFVRRRRGSCR